MQKQRLEVIPKLLRDAHAGDYRGGILSPIKSIFYDTNTQASNGLLAEEVKLVDISFYQVSANFDVMKANGISGAIIRAGQNIWEDSKAVTYMEAAKKANMPIGSYWFYDSRVSPLEQAKKWAEVITGYDTPLFCWADYEENYGGGYKGWDAFYQFLEYCKQYMPNRKFGIYTGYYYWIDNSPNPITQASSLNYFKQYPLWLAWYTPNITEVKIPKPWDKMTFWQYTAKGDGTKLGVESLNIDMDLFLGTKQEYINYFGIEENGDVEVPEITYTGYTLKSGIVVRNTPAGTDTGQRLAAGVNVEIVGQPITAVLNGVSYNWVNLASPVIGWIADILVHYEPVQAPTETHKLEVFVDGVLEFTKEF